MIKLQTLKGFRDFLPNEARKRQYVINILKQVFESYGFDPLETPSLEYEEILLGKYGEEGDKLMYRFEDRGKRKVAMRYDQTVPLARVVAQYGNDLPMPFKRYQIQPVWRAENTKKGRYREFLQCDIDIVGSSSSLADAEVCACVLEAVKKLGFNNSYLELNDRSLFNNIDQRYIPSLDKLKKIGEEGVIDELCKRGLDKENATLLLYRIKEFQPPESLKTAFSLLKSFGLQENKYLRFSPALVRGLDYYTGIIFELFDTQYKNLSLGGGGRYDNLIGMFMKQTNLSAGRQVAAVGFAFGFDRLIEAMTELKLFPKDLTTTKVLLTIFSEEKPNKLKDGLKEKSFSCSLSLRSRGVSTELYLDENASLAKQLKYADKKGIPYAIIIGEDEATKNLVTLRDMKKRKQTTIKHEDILKKIY